MLAEMVGNSFDVQLTSDQMIWMGLIIGLVQAFKDIPKLAFLRDWIPFVILGMSVVIAFSMSWTNPIASGLVLGLMTLGSWKAGTTTGNAIAKRQSGDGLNLGNK
jgi:hypothetical protein